MYHLRDLLAPDRLTAVVDVGANPIDGAPPYRRMLEEGLCTVTGFDPQMSDKPTQGVTYISKVVGSGDHATLHVCEAPGMTSLRLPSLRSVSAFPGFEDWATVVERREVATHRLDDIHEIAHMDMLCMDIQGSEDEALRSGPARIREAVAIITEMSFLPLYHGQPAAGQIDSLLRRYGFIPHCFAAAKVWPIKTKVEVPRCDPHQLLEADMVYVRDFTEDEMTPNQYRHLSLLAHHCFGSFDLAMLCVERLAEREQISPEAPVRYRQLLETMA